MMNVLAILVAAIGGCITPAMVIDPANEGGGGGVAVAPSASTPAADVPMVWPARVLMKSGLKPETEAALRATNTGWQPRGTIVRATPPLMTSRRTMSFAVQKDVDDELKIDEECARAALVEPLPDERATVIKGEGEGSLIFTTEQRDRKDPLPQSPSRATFMFKYLSLRPAVTTPRRDASGRHVAEMQLERTWFSFYDPLPGKNVEGMVMSDRPQAARGVAVVLPGMFGTPQEQVAVLVRKLRNEGWAVVRMLSHPSRFTERRTFEAPIEGELAFAAKLIADELCDRGAECAYAVQAANEYALQERPALRDLPRVVIGMSGGAMVIPAVVALEPGRYQGVVSIAGGVDYLRILTTSNYTDWIDAVRVKWVAGQEEADAPPAERRRALLDAFRAAAPMDSSRIAARALRGIPTLMLHASTDKAVPAKTGEEMWELLGKPERWVIDGGHEWLFLTLGTRVGDIASWLEKKVLAPREKMEPEPEH